MAIKKKAVKTAPKRKTRAKKAAPAKKAAVKRVPRRPAVKPLPVTRVPELPQQRSAELPSGYGDNRIVLMVRDPFWLYTYWEINEKWRREVGSAKLYLRLYNTENWKFHDIETAPGSINWYLHVPRPNNTYCVDIGYINYEGAFVAIARSNYVTTPLDRMSDVIDEQWMRPDWEGLYALSGGLECGRGSSGSFGWFSSFGQRKTE